jgi:hypothetical protein
MYYDSDLLWYSSGNGLFLCAFWWICALEICPINNDHANPIVHELHWPPVKQHTMYKIALLVFKCLHCSEISYLTDLLIPYKPSHAHRPAGASILIFSRTELLYDVGSFYARLKCGPPYHYASALHLFIYTLFSWCWTLCSYIQSELSGLYPLTLWL